MPIPERPRALTLPRVTVKYCPKGFPNAITVSPTLSWSESPKGAVGKTLARRF